MHITLEYWFMTFFGVIYNISIIPAIKHDRVTRNINCTTNLVEDNRKTIEKRKSEVKKCTILNIKLTKCYQILNKDPIVTV